ncbi:50S ribosomal protein L16 [Striga asiatica]|uniref:50S ribosomal protein L16 n=1 Tax=Striga asiatica TaxID=4170 RepID=A0A5A7PBI6_STRAF|nr:50S ribosomal protein L16 [Striga asiatica]
MVAHRDGDHGTYLESRDLKYSSKSMDPQKKGFALRRGTPGLGSAAAENSNSSTVGGSRLVMDAGSRSRMASPNCRNLLPDLGFASQLSAANKALLGVLKNQLQLWSKGLLDQPTTSGSLVTQFKGRDRVAIRGPTLTFEARSVALVGKSGGSRFDNKRPRGCFSVKSPVSLTRNRLVVNGSVLRSWFPQRRPSLYHVFISPSGV